MKQTKILSIYPVSIKRYKIGPTLSYTRPKTEDWMVQKYILNCILNYYLKQNKNKKNV